MKSHLKFEYNRSTILDNRIRSMIISGKNLLTVTKDANLMVNITGGNLIFEGKEYAEVKFPSKLKHNFI